METNRRPLSLALPRRRAGLSWLLAALALAAGAGLVKPAAAQQAATTPNAPSNRILSPAELQNVVGPIALYPDDLVGIVLPASTYPLQIVEAERFLEKRGQDPNLKANPDWDDSVVALLNYPDVVHLLNNDLDWTWGLGTAVLNQRADVLDAIQEFRTRARTAGNLRTDDHQNVTTETDGSIAITPANPQVIYVPYYEPERVVEYQPTPVYSYYPWAYPVYYYPYPADYAFSTGFFWGVTSFFSIGWHSHLLHIHYWGHEGFPYLGWNYYSPFYVRNYVNVNINVPRGGYVWEPQRRFGDRPVVAGRDGYAAERPVPRVGPGFVSPTWRYRQQATASPASAPRAGGVPAATPHYRGSPNVAAPNTIPPRASAGAAPGAANRQGTQQPPRWESYRPAPRAQNETSQRFTTTPAPRYAAPEARWTAPPRAQSFAAAPSRSEVHVAPPSGGGFRSGGGGYRSGGGGGGHAGGSHPGGGHGGEGHGR